MAQQASAAKERGGAAGAAANVLEGDVLLPAPACIARAGFGSARTLTDGQKIRTLLVPVGSEKRADCLRAPDTLVQVKSASPTLVL